MVSQKTKLRHTINSKLGSAKPQTIIYSDLVQIDEHKLSNDPGLGLGCI